MIQLSVNVNKVATLRNSRGGRRAERHAAPSRPVSTAGAPGITVHPRADERHIRPADVADIAALLAARTPHGPRASSSTSKAIRAPDLLDLVAPAAPDQCTLVPVTPGEITSQAGWPPDTRSDALRRRHRRGCSAAGVRVSVFVDPEPAPVRWAADIGRRSHRALHRAVRARVRARRETPAARASRRYAAAASWRTRSGWASTPATISISTTCGCSGRCRTWTRSRSATRSSAARSGSGWIAPCATTSSVSGGRRRAPV